MEGLLDVMKVGRGGQGTGQAGERAGQASAGLWPRGEGRYTQGQLNLAEPKRLWVEAYYSGKIVRSG